MKKIIRLLHKILYFQHREKYDQRSLVMIFLLFSFALSLIEAQFVTDFYNKLILYAFAGLAFVSLLFAYRNILFPGRLIAPTAGFAVITFFVYSNGIYDEAVGGYYLFLVVAGLLLGDKGLIFFGILSACVILGIGFAEYNGWIVTRFRGLVHPFTFATVSMFMLGTTLALHYLILLLNREAENAHKSEKAQLATNEKLRRLQAELEERVNDRTAELRIANEMMQEQLEQIHQLQVMIKDEAIRDPLTGLFNRRYLEETLAREIARANREDYDICFMLLDIDHFKKLNDAYGHSTGDFALKLLAEQLNSGVRAAGIPCRMGGEEFLLVLPGIPNEVARLRAEYFRDQVQATQIPYGEESLTMTVSIGLASYPKNGETWEQLYDAVDQALYRAKQNGRNRVECA